MFAMTIRYWDPYSEMTQATRVVDRIFDQFFGSAGTTSGERGTQKAEVPTFPLPLDILETEGEYVLYAAVPGIDQEKVEVTFDNGILTIWAPAEPLQVNGQWVRRERSYGSFTRKLQLPSEVQPDRISAAFDNGVLTVIVPKLARPQPVKIQVGAAKQVGALSEAATE